MPSTDGSDNDARGGGVRGGGARVTMRRAIVVVLIVAAVWRIAIALAMPVLPRDGVEFCWYARDLGQRGMEHLRDPRVDQHPLFPATVWAADGLLRAIGRPATPVTWQLAGQVVGVLASLGIIVLAAMLTARIVRRMDLAVDANRAAVLAAALAALWPLNVQLGVCAMSDPLHLLLLLIGAWTLVDLRPGWAAPLCGLAAGLAFLTRPEGGILVIGGVSAAVAPRRELRWPQVTWRAVVIVVIFAAFVGSYVGIAGRLTSKKDPLEALKQPSAQRCDDGASRANGARRDGLQFARLEREKIPPYRIPLRITYETVRAGRVVIPLLALVPLAMLRRRLLAPPLIGLTTCFIAHTGLLALLLHRWGYLNQRHTLVLVGLMLPFAAIALAGLHARLPAARRRWVWPVVLVLCGAPLATYALRVPEGDQGHLRAAADWLLEHDANIASKTIAGGASQKRVAFYTDAAWKYWLEDPADFVRIQSEIVYWQPAYFVIETGRGFERRGHIELIEKLMADPTIGPVMTEVFRCAAPRGTLHLYHLAWPSPTTTKGVETQP
jgi:hypothetical protein